MTTEPPIRLPEIRLPEIRLPEIRLDAFDITRRTREAQGPEGRPPLPKTAGWRIFPFEADGLRARLLDDPVVPEPPRHGEDGPGECRTCAAPDDDFVWTDERWRVGMAAEPESVPGVVLHSRPHVDFHELTDEQGAELGVLLVRAQRALASIEGVGRVHVYKWGDGGAHLHVFVVARPLGMMQLRGIFLTTWMYMLPPLPVDQWAAMRGHVARHLAGGPR